MKQYFSYLVFTSIFFVSCSKNKEVQEPLPEGTVLKTGTFVRNNKATSGTVKVVTATNGGTKLVFENFSTGSGPDVRVWLSPNTSTVSYQQVGDLKAFSGNFSYDLSSSINYTTNSHVLIWCEDVSSLFGHAVLQ